MANGINILPRAISKFEGLGQGANNLVMGLLQQQQQRRSGQQFGQVFGPQFSGISNPNIQNLIGQQALQGLQGQQALNLQAAKPISLPTVTELRARRIQQLEAIPETQRTKGQSDQLKKLLEGAAAVQISFGKSTAAERTAIAETEASLDSLSNLESLFNDANSRSGPVVGRLDPILGLFGQTPEEQESFLAASSAFRNKVIKDITGAQMSEPEAKRIREQIPEPTDPPARWKAKLTQTRRNLKAIQKRRSEVLRKSGIIDPLTGQESQTRTPESRALSDEDILRIIGGQ